MFEAKSAMMKKFCDKEGIPIFRPTTKEALCELSIKERAFKEAIFKLALEMHIDDREFIRVNAWCLNSIKKVKR